MLPLLQKNELRPPTLAELRARRDEILSVARRYGASNVRVFGSVAREEPAAGDVDLLIDLEAGRSLLDLEDALLEVAGAVDLAYFPEASSNLRRGPSDISLVEGSITTHHDAERIQQVRRQSKTLALLL